MMDAIGVALANLLPEGYRGVYGDGHADLDAARSVSGAVFDVAG